MEIQKQDLKRVDKLGQEKNIGNVNETHEVAVSESMPIGTLIGAQCKEDAITAQKSETVNVASGFNKLCRNCGDICPEEATKCPRCGHGFG